MTPKAMPHSTGARSDRPASGLGVDAPSSSSTTHGPFHEADDSLLAASIVVVGARPGPGPVRVWVPASIDRSVG
jgi:hypothetical protein